MERFRQRYGIALTKKKLQEIILMLMAAEEIVEGKVGYVRSEAIKRAKAWEDEKAAAILSLNSNDDVQPEEVEVVEDDTEDNE